MIGPWALAVTLNSIVLMPIADRPSSPAGKQDLLDQGYKVMAEGPLLETANCVRYTMRMVPARREGPDTCSLIYGRFQRLKNNDDEFVCVSFREWTCNRSETRN